jgi:hypothetical protein
MKQKIYLLGLATLLITFTGLVFKINHLAGASVALFAGTALLLFIFLPLALAKNYRESGNRSFRLLYIITWVTCFVVFGAMLFKIMHWKYSGSLALIALPFPYLVFLPVFLYTTSRNKDFNIYNTVLVLFLLVISSVLSALLSLNVSKARLSDSYNLSVNYIRTSAIFEKGSGQIPGTAVATRIDDLLKTIEDYRGTILQHEGLSANQWKSDQQCLMRPEERRAAAAALGSNGEEAPGSKLESGLRSLVIEMENSPDYKEVARFAPVIFDLELPDGKEPAGVVRNFTENNLSWALICLDGLEANLKMLKALAPDSGIQDPK